MKTQTATLYELYNKRRAELISLTEQQRDILSKLNIDKSHKEATEPGIRLNSLGQRLREENLRVLVMGEFSAGKSTFINALLGTGILPAKALPTTAVINEIRYADEPDKRIVMYPKPGQWARGDEPFDIGVDELEQYVAIDHSDNADKTAPAPFDRMELYWPLELCRNNVEIVDSPGLNDPASHDKVTISYLPTADAIIYCICSEHPCSRVDMETIKMLRDEGYTSIIFAITKFDRVKESALLNGTAEDEEFVKVITEKLRDLTDLAEEGIFFVDSLHGLLGKIRGNEIILHESNIPQVEEYLEHHLVEHRGKAKFVKTIYQLRTFNSDAARLIDDRISLANTSLDELQTRFNRAQEPLQKLKQRGEIILSQIKTGIADILRRTSDAARLFIIDCPDKIEAWVNDYTPENQISKNPLKMRQSVENLANEYIGQIKIKMKQEGAAWGNNLLSPMIDSALTDVFSGVKERTQDYTAALKKLRIDLTFDTKADGAEIAEDQDPSKWSKLGGVVYGFATQDWVGAGMTSVFGFKGLLRSLTTQITAGILLSIISVFTPIGWPAIIIGIVLAACVSGGWNYINLADTVKKKVIEACESTLRQSEQQAQMAKAIEQQVGKELQGVVDEVNRAFQQDIASVESEVEQAIKRKKKGDIQIIQEKRLLAEAKQANESLSEEIFDLAIEAGI